MRKICFANFLTLCGPRHSRETVSNASMNFSGYRFYSRAFTKSSLPYLFFFLFSCDLSFFDIALIISISRSRVSRFFYERLRVMSNRINGLVSQSIRRISLAIRYDITCHRLERSQGELHFSQTWLHSSTFEGRAVGKKVPRGWIFSSESLIPPRNEDWRSS